MAIFELQLITRTVIKGAYRVYFKIVTSSLRKTQTFVQRQSDSTSACHECHAVVTDLEMRYNFYL